MDRGEFLKRLCAPEFGHCSLSSPERLVRLFSSIVQPPPGYLTCLVAGLFHCCSAGAKTIRHNFHRITASLHRLLQKFKHSLAISLLCDVGLKDFTLMIDGSPKIMNLAINPNEKLIQMPPPLWQVFHRLGPLLSDFSGEFRPEPIPPSTNCFVADINGAFVENIFNLSQQQWETNIHHHCGANNLRRSLKISEWVFHRETLRNL